ncbi:MAG: deoxyguanosinetriphosphate triphosphohydrolase [Candidatus Rickettsia vulgarisii]
MLATYACDPSKNKGRLYKEQPTNYRNEFERDRDRIIHSKAFRRLQYKTQVFINHEGDHYRNRLTHSIEVATVARSIANTLNLSSDLAETVALAHDLGHTPFGHAGEIALDECMKNYGGFSHNAHTLKILTKIEKRYAVYDGLNLTWEVLEGIVKHNGPMINNVPTYIKEYNLQNDLDLGRYSSAEAQVASLADDISYISHDLEDSLGTKIIDFNHLSEVKFINQYINDVRAQYKEISSSRLTYEIVRKLTSDLITDLLKQTNDNLKKQKIVTTEDIRSLDYQIVDFTDQTKERINEIRQFLFNKVYKHNKLTSMTLKCQKIIKELFKLYMDNIDLLPFNWKALIIKQDESFRAGIVADYIAGMTDRFAIREYQDLYSCNFNNV